MSRASHTHHAPQVGLPQAAPVHSAITVKMAPVGANARAYWYDQLRQSLRNGRVKIEDDDRVKDDLAIVFYKFKNGKLFIISKEEMRKDHGRSPDHADALAYATAPVQDGLPVGSAVSQEAEDAISGFMDGLDDSGLEIAPF